LAAVHDVAVDDVRRVTRAAAEAAFAFGAASS
jgi:hypothetical protein